MKLTLGIISTIKDYQKLKKNLFPFFSNFNEIIIAVDKKEKLFFKDKFKSLKNKPKLIFFSVLNFSLIREKIRKYASNNWILYIDSDEKIDIDLIEEVKTKINNNTIYDSFLIRRKEFFWNKEVKFGEVWKARKKGFIRLIKKNSPGKWQGMVHEEFKNFEKAGKINSYIKHYSHINLADFIKSIKKYSDIRIKEINKKIFFHELLLIPFLKFFYTYFLLLGFLDGARGFVYSFMMSFYSFLVRTKLYSKQNLTK